MPAFNRLNVDQDQRSARTSMLPPRIKSVVIYAVLLILIVSGFFIRIDNYRKSKTRTIDELVYYHLGAQLKDHFPAYHARNFARLLLEIRPNFAPLPQYFTQPLFKHPPLFAAFVSLALRIFGEHYYSAAYVSVFFGVMMILLTYWVGEFVFDECVGLSAAFFVWLDPVNIIASQKIWMDTTLSFFMLLAVYCFLRGIRDQNLFAYAGFGLAAGCALLTKYAGILTLLSAGFYLAFLNRKSVRPREALLCFGLPFLLFTPWLIWNGSVYGTGVLAQMFNVHSLSKMTLRSVSIVSFLSGSLVIIALGWFLKAKFFTWKIPVASILAQRQKEIKLAALGFFLLFFGMKFFPVLGVAYQPETYWQPGRFAGEPAYFYLKRLPEFSLLYLVSFCALFFSFEGEQKQGAVILKFFSAVILIFFTIWQNYQLRYILAATPLLLILAAALWLKIVNNVCREPHLTRKRLGVIMISLVSAYVIFKTYYVNMAVSFPNDMCYF